MRFVLNLLYPVLITISLIGEANASVLFDAAASAENGPKYTLTSANQVWVVSDYRPVWTTGGTQFPAMPFSVMYQSHVTGAELALTGGGRDNYAVQIFRNNSPFAEDTPIWIASSLEMPAIQQSLQQTYSFTHASGESVLLEANTLYWLSVSCLGQCQFSWWADPKNPVVNAAIQTNNQYPYSLRWVPSEDNSAMFRITGSVLSVPEPGTNALLLVGLGFISIVARRRKFQTLGALHP